LKIKFARYFVNEREKHVMDSAKTQHYV